CGAHPRLTVQCGRRQRGCDYNTATAVHASCSASPPPHATLASRAALRLYRGLHRPIAPSVAWRLPSFDTSSAAHEQCRWHVEAEHFRRGRLITSSNFVGNSSNTLPSFVPFSILS